MKSFGVALASVAFALMAKAGDVKVNPATRMLEDQDGRSVLFHGVNVVYKVDPYIPSMDGEFDSELSLNDQDIQDLVDWGMNFVRLGVMWEGVERVAGQYDQKYLDSVERLINRLGEAGIYTLVDNHQDVFARSICGEGVPDFYAKEVVGKHPSCINPIVDHLLEPIFNKFGICKAISDYGYRYDDNGDPLIEDCQSINFGIYYSSPDSINAFDALYNNKNGLRDKFVAFWDATSARFVNNRYVLGFDPFNEPAIGNYYRDPTLLLPGQMDRRSLAPLYTEVFEKYMANSEEAIMWFEPNTFPNVIGTPFGDGLIPGVILPAGFETPPGGEFGSKNHVFNDHTYCCQLNPQICSSGEPRADRVKQCYNWHKQRVGKRAADAERYGIPLHLTEFGACLTEGPCTQEIRQVTEIADEYLVGWAYWQFKTYGDLTTSAGTGSEGFYDPDGSLQTWKVKALSRTYLMATQGVPTSQEFDMDTSEFTSTFTVNTDIDAPTVVYVNRKDYYQNGLTYTATHGGNDLIESGSVTVDDSDSLYLKFTVKEASLNGAPIQITVSQTA